MLFTDVTDEDIEGKDQEESTGKASTYNHPRWANVKFKDWFYFLVTCDDYLCVQSQL